MQNRSHFTGTRTPISLTFVFRGGLFRLFVSCLATLARRLALMLFQAHKIHLHPINKTNQHSTTYNLRPRMRIPANEHASKKCSKPMAHTSISPSVYFARQVAKEQSVCSPTSPTAPTFEKPETLVRDSSNRSLLGKLVQEKAHMTLMDSCPLPVLDKEDSRAFVCSPPLFSEPSRIEPSARVA